MGIKYTDVPDSEKTAAEDERIRNEKDLKAMQKAAAHRRSTTTVGRLAPCGVNLGAQHPTVRPS